MGYMRDSAGRRLDSIEVPSKGEARPKGTTTPSPFFPTAPLALQLKGIDAVDDRLFAIDNSTNLVMSVDRGATYGTSKGLPAGVTGSTVQRIFRWGAHLYLIGFNTTSSRVELYRASPAPVLNDPFTWSAALLQLTAGSAGGFATQVDGSAWGDGQDALIVVDYGPDPTGGPSMWRSTDGTTWTKVLGPIAATRHMHAVYADPYRAGHWWMTCGDGTGHQFYRSTDHGVTWTKLAVGAGGADLSTAPWQAVQISSDATALYFAADSQQYSVFKLRRADLDAGTVRPVIAPRFHQHLWLPNGKGPRGPFTDGGLTAGTKNLTSATAAFTADDVGRIVTWTASVNPGGYPTEMRFFIASVTNSTTVVLNKQANGTATNVAFSLSGDVLFAGAFYGAVDPATGIFYQLANDTLSGGTRCGLFATFPDGHQVLLESWGFSYSAQVFIYQGYVYCGRMKRPLLAVGDWGL